MRLETKAASATARRPMAIGEPDGRTFKGFASTWDVDYGGDLILPGAYADTIATWRQGGRPIPLMDSHNYGSIFNIIGQLTDAKETREGLLATFEVIGGADGDGVLERVRAKAVNGLSVGYRVPPGGERTPDATERARGARRVITRILLHEVSLCMSPMNPNARVTSADGKAVAFGPVEQAELRERFDTLRTRYREDQAAERAEKFAKLKAFAAEEERRSWAPDDPRRIALAAQLRRLKLRSLQLSA